MDNLTPGLTETLASLGQFYPQTASEPTGGSPFGGGGLSGGGEEVDYSGNFSDVRGLMDQLLGQQMTLQQANNVLGGQINSFSGSLTGAKDQIGKLGTQIGEIGGALPGIKTDVGKLQTGLAATDTKITGLGSQMNTMGTNITQMQTNDANQSANLLTIINALKQDPHMGQYVK